ncbi:MAG: SPOR domain-containing protein [Rickettsiales bacterium]|nr:SPOR domain-containing protein [Rickettsiales bacterium]
MADEFERMVDKYKQDGSGPELPRFVPVAVVFGAIAGFAWLAWYAYHSGAQSLNEDNLIVIEADSVPIKEKPLDPGGMKFPNQDKTVFETFSSNNQPPKVERVLPPPEDPMPKGDEDADTKTWVNDKLQQKEKVAIDEERAKKVAEDAVRAFEDAAKAEEGEAKQAASDPKAKAAAKTPAENSTGTIRKDMDSSIKTYTAEKTPEKIAEKAAEKPVEKPADKPVEKPVEKVAEKAKEAPAAKTKVATKPEAKPAKEVAAEEPSDDVVVAEKEEKPAAAPKATASGAAGTMLQLGAWRSEKECRDAFASLQKKYKALGQKTPVIVKADLGDKGIYYRLRIGGFANAQDAKAYCATLTSKGISCNRI